MQSPTPVMEAWMGAFHKVYTQSWAKASPDYYVLSDYSGEVVVALLILFSAFPAVPPVARTTRDLFSAGMIDVA
jgi:hypothetical protein